jgi:tetratricopeptide (TPR) repeat protein
MSTANVRCPSCRRIYAVPEKALGTQGRCRKCDLRFELVRTDAQDAATTPLAGEWSPKDCILGEFDVQRKLGQGGMGGVYLVTSRTNGRQFAVKKALFRKEESQRNFLRELVTWIDLPEHPNLTPCRFFRTVGDEIAIFTDFVEGGTLADWVRMGKLLRLEDLMDVLIQFAWALHVAHECGATHRDVKPANVLMTPDGGVKVTDFGLAAAVGVSGVSPAANGVSVLISAGGKTAAYASPEQDAGRKLSRKTDQWSFGVSVLDLFVGKVGCCGRSGTLAPAVLKAYLKQGPLDERLPRMPPRLVEILEQCFQDDPTDRWPSMAVVKTELCAVTRKPYARVLEPVPAAQAKQVPHDRRTTTGARWTDPREWLVKALTADGRDAAEADDLIPPRPRSRQAQATADMAAYDEAQRIYTRLVGAGRKDLETDLATLAHNKAFVYEAAQDLVGAVAQYDLCINIRRRLVEQEGRRELEPDLARAYMNKAIAVKNLGDNREAVRLYDLCIGLYQRLVEQEGRSELKGDLAWSRLNRAEVLLKLGERTMAAREVREALPALEAEITRTNRADLRRVRDWAAKALKDVL